MLPSLDSFPEIPTLDPSYSLSYWQSGAFWIVHWSRSSFMVHYIIMAIFLLPSCYGITQPHPWPWSFVGTSPRVSSFTGSVDVDFLHVSCWGSCNTSVPLHVDSPCLCGLLAFSTLMKCCEESLPTSPLWTQNKNTKADLKPTGSA